MAGAWREQSGYALDEKARTSLLEGPGNQMEIEDKLIASNAGRKVIL